MGEGPRAQADTLRPPGWHREAVGGLWDEIGELQFRYLVDEGLRPGHTLLDIGCGSLRGGRHFIAYLDPGNYVGVDRNPELIAAGIDNELDPAVRQVKRPELVEMADFGFDRLGRTFDFALAQSVFTHLPLNSIIRCLVNVRDALTAGGTFCATFFESPVPRHLEPIRQQPVGVVTYFDRDPFHYDIATFQWACTGTGLEVERVGDWSHPRGQKMLALRHSA